jgi:hypothetical protein
MSAYLADIIDKILHSILNLRNVFENFLRLLSLSYELVVKAVIFGS